MTIEETADALINRADLALNGVSSEDRGTLAQEIASFLSRYEVYLSNNGSQWRNDDLDGARSRLMGQAPGTPQAAQSSFFAGVKSWVGDSSSAREYWSQAAADEAKKLGAAAANVLKTGADEAGKGILKSPALVAVLVVGLVLAGAWVWRSVK